jgi:hypothetical protein
MKGRVNTAMVALRGEIGLVVPSIVVIYNPGLKLDSCAIGGGRKERDNQAVAPLDVLSRIP